MKINFNPIKYTPITYNQPNFNGRFHFFSRPAVDTFEKRKKDKKNTYPEKLFSYENDLKEYKRMKKHSLCENEAPVGLYSTKEAAEKSYEMAKIIKRGLDKKYGEKKYAIVSIGTSPSGIARALDYMGEDVKYLPISNLRGFHNEKEGILSDIKKKNRGEYKKYLDSIGLNAETINNGDKKIIFYDFTKSGATLDAIKQIVTGNKTVNSSKLKFRSINDDLIKFANTKAKKRICNDYISNYMLYSKISKYTGIPHIPYSNTDEIKEKAKKERSDDVRDFNLALCYFIDQDGLLK